MAEQLPVQEIIRHIRSQFRDGQPNGWLLNWDESRLFTQVSIAAAPHEVLNCTTFDYAFCNWYEIPISTGHNDWILTIKLSFIVPAYCMYWTEHDTVTGGSVAPIAPMGYQNLEDKVRFAAESAGLFELPSEWHDHEVQGVTLDLSNTSNVTIDKCLFCDHDN